MRLIKMFGLVSLVAVAAMAFVGATSASAQSTQYCKVHTSSVCPENQAVTQLHLTIPPGTVVKHLSSLVNVLCLGALVLAGPLGLGSPQSVHTTALETTGCGTGSAHSNCTITVEEFPLLNVLNVSLDEGVWTATSGRERLVCANLGINCVYDMTGLEFAAGAGHLTAEETPTTELGGKFFCPDNGFLDGLLEMLAPAYILE